VVYSSGLLVDIDPASDRQGLSDSHRLAIPKTAQWNSNFAQQTFERYACYGNVLPYTLLFCEIEHSLHHRERNRTEVDLAAVVSRRRSDREAAQLPNARTLRGGLSTQQFGKRVF